MGLASRVGCQPHRRVLDDPIDRTRDARERRRREHQSARTEPSRSGAAFIASMQGLREFTLQAARELNPYSIQVHAVSSDRETVVETVLALLTNESEEK